jgi:hypothetical protein
MMLSQNYVAKLTKEAKDRYENGGIKLLAICAYESSKKEIKERKLYDYFYAGLVYYEFFAETNDEYTVAIELRKILCDIIGVNQWSLYKETEALFGNIIED